MSEHTKTPWHVEKGEKVYICSQETVCDETTVVNFGFDGEANARHIVHCVNNHERLVEMVQALAYDYYLGTGGKHHEPAHELLATLEAEKGGEL